MIVNESLLDYALSRTTPEPGLLAQLDRETHLTQVYPRMLAGHLQGSLLRMIVRMIRPARILEIGTFTGYSALAMAGGWDDPSDASDSGISAGRPGIPRLHTIEVNPELEDRIRKYIREAGMEDRIILHIGDALEILPSMDETWDLVYIDADKPNYVAYYSQVFPNVRPGGFIIADNVLWDGKVTGDPAGMDRDTRGIVDFNQFVLDDDRVENLLLPVRDGLMLIRKK